MRDQYYVVSLSDSSMSYYPENATTNFITQLPQCIQLQGNWTVALTEIQIPLTFQNIPPEKEEKIVRVRRIPCSLPLLTNRLLRDKPSLLIDFLKPGTCKNIESLINEINNLSCMKNHLELTSQQGGYIGARRICSSE